MRANGSVTPVLKPAGAARVRWVHYLQIALLCLPVLVTFWYVRTFAVEVPMWDDWDYFVVHVHNLATGQLRWDDFNVQHNEALILFPMSLTLLMAELTGGQVLAGVYASYVFLCGSLGLLFGFFRMLRLPGRWSLLWFLPVSVFFLGWRQSEGLIGHVHLTNTMALFFVLAALYCCTQAERIPIFFLAAMLSAWIASFSVTSGLLAWPLGLLYFVMAPLRGRPFEQVVRHAVAWFLIGGICFGCFYLNFRPATPPWATGASLVLANPAAAAQYALIYLGGPLSPTPAAALYAGIAVLAIAAPTAIVAWLKGRNRDGVVPALLLVVLVAATLGPLLTHRLGLGVPQAFASRYVTLSSLAPIGIYYCVLSLMHDGRKYAYLAGAMVLLLGYGIFNSYSAGLRDGRTEYAKRTECARVIRNFRRHDPSRFSCSYPDPAVVRDRVGWLEQSRLSLFRR